MRVRLGLAASYAAAVEYGTAPHEITPMNGGVLAFEVAGKMMFTPIVHHPGTRANPFMQRALEEALGKVDRFLLICGLSWWVAKHGSFMIATRLFLTPLRLLWFMCQLFPNSRVPAHDDVPEVPAVPGVPAHGVDRLKR